MVGQFNDLKIKAHISIVIKTNVVGGMAWTLVLKHYRVVDNNGMALRCL